MRVASEPPTEPHGRSYLETLAAKEDLPHSGPDPMHTAEAKQGHPLRVL
jgi:hypothetical protein